MEFLLILLPVFGIFAIGFIGQKTLKFDIPNLSKLTLYLMSPFLAFNTFYTNALTIDYAYLAIYIFALCLSLILLVSLISFLLGYNLQDRCALILASAFMNNGNYGTPVVLLVFGAVGLDIAVVLMVLQQLAMSTIGIYFAAKGSKDANGMKTVMKPGCSDADCLRGFTRAYASITSCFTSIRFNDLRKTCWRRCYSNNYDCPWNAVGSYFV